MLSDTALRYVDLLSRYRWLASGLCWTVIEAADGHADTMEVLNRLGADLAQVRSVAVGADLASAGAAGLVHADVLGDAVVLLEPNGFLGSQRGVMAQLSGGGRAHSAFWNVNGDNQLVYAADGRVVTEMDGQFPEDRAGENPAALDDDIADLFDVVGGTGAAGDWQAAMLAVIERRTGVALTARWLAEEHPTVVVAVSATPVRRSMTANIAACQSPAAPVPPTTSNKSAISSSRAAGFSPARSSGDWP